jgi:hypothetical protein
MMPSTTPRLNLTDVLSPQSHSAAVRIAHEFGINFDDLGDVKYLCWMIEILKHVRDTNRNFPHGKWSTIKALESAVSECAAHCARLFYGNV